MSDMRDLLAKMAMVNTDDGVPVEASNNSSDVNMDVSITGRGTDGVRDLMDILRNFEEIDGSDNDDDEDDEILLSPSDSTGTVSVGDEEIIDEFENSPDIEVKTISDITPSGNDMNSKGKLSPIARAGASNPMRGTDEALLTHLKELYTQIKGR